ncbi:hypothetical protein Leryth_006663 [Lithospermum erythrorhizon]|nr:hypothetical protein Leryth_006663 [Lithospermum erythrorhizon]
MRVVHPHLHLRSPSPTHFLKMSIETNTNSPQNDPNPLESYPIPLSPPLPLISKDLELNRALTASSKSSLFKFSKNDALFQDQWLIAVNKPQGVYCESLLSAVPTLLTHSGTQLNSPQLHLANRLDRDTSGVTIITKSHKVASKLVKAFTDHKIRKTYVAFCTGPAPQWKNITVRSGHGRSKFGAWRVYGVSDVGRVLPGGSFVRDMETSFEVLSINGQRCIPECPGSEKEGDVVVVEEKSTIDCNSRRDEILVRAYPRSGRTHQIRLHCQYLGIPIRGDVKYEGVYEFDGKRYEGHQLHAESLSFEHPMTAQPLLIQSPLPSWASYAV